MDNNINQKYIETPASYLVKRAEEYRNGGWCLSQIHCTKTKDGKCELIYTFEKDYIIEHLRLVLEDSNIINSISGIYAYAYIYENEIKDLFGVDIAGINIDFKGNFYKTAVKTPFNIQLQNQAEEKK